MAKDYTQYCGRIATRVLGNGMFYRYRWLCGNYHLCPRCLQIRAANLEKRYKNLTNPVALIVADQAAATKLGRVLGTDNYLRVPLADGSIAIVAEQAQITANEALATYADIAQPLAAIGGWATLAATPEGKRITGHLGTKPTPVNPEPAAPEDTVTTTIYSIHTDAPYNIQDQCCREALQDTSVERPADADACLRALHKRTIRYAVHLQERGYEAVFLPTIETVKLDCEHWLMYEPSLILQQIIIDDTLTDNSLKDDVG